LHRRAFSVPRVPRPIQELDVGDPETMGIDEGMRATTKLSIALVALIGLCFTAIGVIHQKEAGATTAIKVEQAKPTITITTQPASPPYTYNPAQLNAKVGQPITVTNNDPNGVHSVTAKDRSFNVDVPPTSSVTLTIQKAGSFAYNCTYHADEHNPASINVS
jgi:plastocyanin